MSEHESLAEAKLRSDYLDHIHSGDDDSRTQFIETFKQENDVVKTGVAVSGENIEITINKLGKDNHVKYGINVGDNSEELQDTYYNEPITIEKNDVITFQECTNEGECYKQQTLFFDGVNTTKTIDIERPENLFENQEKIESIRKSISEKRVEITVAENNMEAIYEKLDRKNSEKKEIEERLAMVNERIINSFG